MGPLSWVPCRTCPSRNYRSSPWPQPAAPRLGVLGGKTVHLGCALETEMPEPFLPPCPQRAALTCPAVNPDGTTLSRFHHRLDNPAGCLLKVPRDPQLHRVHSWGSLALCMHGDPAKARAYYMSWCPRHFRLRRLPGLLSRGSVGASLMRLCTWGQDQDRRLRALLPQGLESPLQRWSLSTTATFKFWWILWLAFSLELDC